MGCLVLGNNISTLCIYRSLFDKNSLTMKIFDLIYGHDIIIIILFYR